MKTIGQNISVYRKQKGLTQEGLAELCSVTPQAVSKWENDASYPDIALLKPLARIFGISVDELLDDGEGPVTRLAPAAPDISKMLLRLRVNGADGDKVSINLPLKLVEMLVGDGTLAAKLGDGKGSDWLKSVDFSQVISLVSLGVTGKLLEVQSADGDLVEIWVE